MILQLVCNEPGNFNCILLYFLHADYKIPSPTVKYYEILLVLELQSYSSSHLMTFYQMLIAICTVG